MERQEPHDTRETQGRCRFLATCSLGALTCFLASYSESGSQSVLETYAQERCPHYVRDVIEILDAIG